SLIRDEIAESRNEVAVEKGGVHALDSLRTAGIKLTDLVRSKGVESGLIGVALAAQPQRTSAVRACGAIHALVLDHAVEKGGRGDVTHHARRFPSPGAFIIAKEEGAIFLDRTSRRCAENVPDQLWWCFQEIIAGAGVGVAMILIRRPVKIVGAALGDQSHLGA